MDEPRIVDFVPGWKRRLTPEQLAAMPEEPALLAGSPPPPDPAPDAPTEADLSRDLAADLAKCDGLLPGPWVDGDLAAPWMRSVFGLCGKAWGDWSPHDENLLAILEAREGWPAAIRLALHYKAEVERLRGAVELAVGSAIVAREKMGDTPCSAEAHLDELIEAGELAAGAFPRSGPYGKAAGSLRASVVTTRAAIQGELLERETESERLRAGLAHLEADGAALRRAFESATVAYFNAMNGRPRAEWNNEPKKVWEKLYEAVRDTTAGVAVIAEVAVLRKRVAELEAQRAEYLASIDLLPVAGSVPPRGPCRMAHHAYDCDCGGMGGAR